MTEDSVWVPWVLEIEWTEPGLPRLVGPFFSHDDAVGWAKLNIPNGSWEVRPLARPYAASYEGISTMNGAT